MWQDKKKIDKKINVRYVLMPIWISLIEQLYFTIDKVIYVSFRHLYFLYPFVNL